jgi:hypothetical protein
MEIKDKMKQWEERYKVSKVKRKRTRRGKQEHERVRDKHIWKSKRGKDDELK